MAQKTMAREGEKLNKFRGFWRSRRRHAAPKSLFPELSVYSGEGTGGFTSAPTPRSRGQEPRMLTMLLRKYERLKFLKECDRVSLVRVPSYLNVVGFHYLCFSYFSFLYESHWEGIEPFLVAPDTWVSECRGSRTNTCIAALSVTGTTEC